MSPEQSNLEPKTIIPKMSSVVAVAGGTGGLGHAIVDELVASGKYTVLVFSRKDSESKSKELGAKVVGVDYSDSDSVVRTLEEHNVDTVLSTLDSMSGVAAELTFIQAADKSKVTKRYIPSCWGLKYSPEVAKILVMSQSKVELLNALAKTSLEYTAVVNGFFMDYFILPHGKSYLPNFPIAIDIANKFAGIPGTGDEPVTFTYTFDIGRMMASFLAKKGPWEKETYIKGDVITLNELLAIAEEARGTKFEVHYDPLEKLESMQVTEMPGHTYMYGFLPKDLVQAMSAQFGLLFVKGYMNFESQRSLNDVFPDIKTRKAKELVTEAWKGK